MGRTKTDVGRRKMKLKKPLPLDIERRMKKKLEEKPSFLAWCRANGACAEGRRHFRGKTLKEGWFHPNMRCGWPQWVLRKLGVDFSGCCFCNNQEDREKNLKTTWSRLPKVLPWKGGRQG